MPCNPRPFVSAVADNLQLFMRPSDLLKKKQPTDKLIERNYNGLPFKYDQPK